MSRILLQIRYSAACFYSNSLCSSYPRLPPPPKVQFCTVWQLFHHAHFTEVKSFIQYCLLYSNSLVLSIHIFYPDWFQDTYNAACFGRTCSIQSHKTKSPVIKFCSQFTVPIVKPTPRLNYRTELFSFGTCFVWYSWTLRIRSPQIWGVPILSFSPLATCTMNQGMKRCVFHTFVQSNANSSHKNEALHSSALSCIVPEILFITVL